MTRRSLIVVALSFSLLVSCVTPEYYQFPESNEVYATIEDDWDPFRIGDYVRVVSIDRKSIKLLKKKNEKIPLNQGIHQLHVQACEYSFLHGLLGLGTGAYKCTEAVLRLEPTKGTQYRVNAITHIEEDYADFWIEKIGTGECAVNKLRVTGLHWE